jgi:hypothetical protein
MPEKGHPYHPYGGDNHRRYTEREIKLAGKEADAVIHAIVTGGRSLNLDNPTYFRSPSSGSIVNYGSNTGLSLKESVPAMVDGAR